MIQRLTLRDLSVGVRTPAEGLSVGDRACMKRAGSEARHAFERACRLDDDCRREHHSVDVVVIADLAVVVVSPTPERGVRLQRARVSDPAIDRRYTAESGHWFRKRVTVSIGGA